jgi:hypothetical protein
MRRPPDEFGRDKNTIATFSRSFSVPIYVGCASILSNYQTNITGEYEANFPGNERSAK